MDIPVRFRHGFNWIGGYLQKCCVILWEINKIWLVTKQEGWNYFYYVFKQFSWKIEESRQVKSNWNFKNQLTCCFSKHALCEQIMNNIVLHMYKCISVFWIYSVYFFFYNCPSFYMILNSNYTMVTLPIFKLNSPKNLKEGNVYLFTDISIKHVQLPICGHIVHST